LRHLSESGAIYQDTDGRWTLRRSMAELGLPQSVREVVGRRVERLGGDASKALAVAAVIGRDFDVDLLARVVDQEEDELLDLLDLGAAQRQAGEPTFRETLLDAGAAARELTDPDRLAAAALANTRGFGASTYGEVDEERVAVIEAALAIMPAEDAATRAQLLVKLAVELNWGGNLPRRVSLVDEALALARRSGDDRTLGMVLSEGSITTWVPWT